MTIFTQKIKKALNKRIKTLQSKTNKLINKMSKNKLIRKVTQIFPNKYFKAILLIAIIIFTLKLNLTTRGFGLDMIIIFFWIIATLQGKGKKFIKDWWLYIVLFWVYESARGFADNIGNFLHRKMLIDFLINSDKLLFAGNVPNVWLQQHLPIDSMPYWFLVTLFIFYTTFFWYWASVGFILWLKDKKIFKDYMNTLLILSFIAAGIYALFPSAPPWYASSLRKLPPLNRFLWSKIFPGNGISVVHFWDQNYFAAFPSLHFGWPFLASIYLIKYKQEWKWYRYLSLIVPFAICFAIVYGAEHYVSDCLASFIIIAIINVIKNLYIRQNTTTKPLN